MKESKTKIPDGASLVRNVVTGEAKRVWVGDKDVSGLIPESAYRPFDNVCIEKFTVKDEGWISVKEELPEKGVDVRVHPPKKHWNGFGVHTARLMREGVYENWVYYQENSSYRISGVTHWQSLNPPSEIL